MTINTRRAAKWLIAGVMLLNCAVAHGSAMDFRKPGEKDDPFAQDIRKTNALTPQQEQKTFHLPPGFEIQLVASEPDILKPVNMQFDAKGRLWITNTHEYPFPAPLGKERDSIKVIEIGPDGHATKITTFRDHLNIPIGLYPYKDGVIAHSIPKISMYWDDAGGDYADQKKVLYGDFGYKADTHGMTGNFRRGFDGYLYATHGFNNKSHVTALNGMSIKLESGNTYRMGLDGNYIEQFTWGQTNPFGLCFDPLGNLYSADSHSRPIMQLLRGGYYIGISKSDDGLGFAPMIMNHMHGSTAIAGVVYYAAKLFPKEYWGRMFVGNVVTSRINQDSITHVGSTPVAHEEKDFLICDDPWFRPVDTQVGPDGALYIADFYNRIIAHYEVPLDNPGRDRERGRIWRITYHGAPANFGPDWSKAALPDLITGLANDNLAVRMIVMNQITDRFGPAANDAVATMVHDSKSTIWQKVHGLWLLYRGSALDLPTLSAAAGSSDTELRVHAMRILAETHPWSDSQRELALAGLADSDALVRRCAADAFSTHPAGENVRPLLALDETTPKSDAQLKYTARMALRNQLRPPGVIANIGGLSPNDALAIADVLPSIPTAEAANFLIDHGSDLAGDPADIEKYLHHAVKYADVAHRDQVAEFIHQQYADDLDQQLLLYQTLVDASRQSRAKLGDKTRQWGGDLADRVLRMPPSGWTAAPADNLPPSSNPWTLEMVPCSDGVNGKRFLSSRPLGETLTGKYRSPPFAIPAKFSFFFAGHDGNPSTQPASQNFVRLIDVQTGEKIAEAHPPRNDVAQKITWDLHDQRGRRAYLELIDGDPETAYAWIAVGRFNPPVVHLPTSSNEDQRVAWAAHLALEMHLTGQTDQLRKLMGLAGASDESRVAAAAALLSFHDEASIAAMAAIVANPSEQITVREQIARALGDSNIPAARTALVGVCKEAPGRVQTAIAKVLAKSHDGANILFDAVAAGKAPPRLLQDPALLQSLKAAGIKDLDARVQTLTQGLPSPKAEMAHLIEQRRAAFRASTPNADHGRLVFIANCTVCHQLDGVGHLVGPQLDGIGNRGVDRLVEDVMDPNANVDPAFHFSTVTLDDGTILTALQKRSDADTISFTDTTGKEITVRKDEIVQRVESSASLMPTNFSEILKPADFNDLIAFLLTHKGQKK